MRINVSSAPRMAPDNRAALLGLAAALPLLVWWLGWYPGFMSPDSIDQLGQVARFEFTNFHPAFHTITLWLTTRVWNTPAAVALLQVIGLGVLLAVVARRLVRLGVPVWAAAGAAWAVGLAPAVGPMVLSIWKDVPFALAMLWVFAELLALAGAGASFWDRPAGPVRLGAALALVWLFRHNGLLTALVLLAVLAVVYRRSWRGVAKTAAVAAGLVILVQGPVYALFSVDRARPATAELLIPDVAAQLTHNFESFSGSELDYLETIARPGVWRELYHCYSADALLFSPDFAKQIIRDDPGPFRSLAVRSVLRNPATALGHHWCMASFLLVPAQPGDVYLHRPPFEIPPNTLGLARTPVVEAAFRATKAVFVWAEPPGRLWLTWRPALVIWAAAGLYAAVAARRRLRPLLWAGAPAAIHLVNAAATSLGQEVRFAFPIYLIGLLSLPLAVLVVRPAGARVGGSTGRALEVTGAPGVVNGRPDDGPHGRARLGSDHQPDRPE